VHDFVLTMLGRWFHRAERSGRRPKKVGIHAHHSTAGDPVRDGLARNPDRDVL